MQAAANLKMSQRRLIESELKLVESSSQNRTSIDHPVLPTKSQISLIAAQALDRVVDAGQPKLVAIGGSNVADAILAI